MKLEDLIDTTIEVAALCPRIDAIFLLDSKRSMCALAPDDEFADGKTMARFVSVQGSEALSHATVIGVGGCSPVEACEGETPFTYSETYILTTKGRCSIITCLMNGQPNQAAPLVALPHKGYPPSDAVTLVDFARIAIPGRNNGDDALREQKVQGVLSDVSAPTG